MAHIPRLHVPGRVRPGPITLEGDQAKRLSTVMRLREGDRFLLFAGDGQEWQVLIENTGRQRVHARVEDLVRQEAPQSPRLEIALSVVRANRMDWAIEKCVEAGIDTIRPITTGRTARGDAAGRQDRWRRVVTEAAEQSGRVFVPEVLAPLSLESWMLRQHGGLFFGDGEGRPWGEAQRLIPASGSIAFAIGPEGGFSPEEAAKLRAAGGVPVCLGPNTLRTETAAVVATALVRSMHA